MNIWEVFSLTVVKIWGFYCLSFYMFEGHKTFLLYHVLFMEVIQLIYYTIKK